VVDNCVEPAPGSGVYKDKCRITLH